MGEPEHAAMRERILREPDMILEDIDVMRALVAAGDRQIGGNVIDLRGIAMERLEYRLDRLEETHRTVIAAAYDNLAGMNMVHRAVLSLLDPDDFGGFLTALRGPVSDVLRVDTLHLLLETAVAGATVPKSVTDVMALANPGGCAEFVGTPKGQSARRVTLRQCAAGDSHVHGPDGNGIRSEACLMLDLGSDRLPGLLLLGAEDPHLFAPGQGTDLLGFFAGVVERSLRRWLA